MSKEKHHYLPKGILKPFSIDRNNKQIYFINKKQLPKSIKANLNKVACKNHFYDFESEDNSLEVTFFGDIDNKAPKVIKKILSRQKLEEADKNSLIRYVASQIVRTPYTYNRIEKLINSLVKYVGNNDGFLGESKKNFFLDKIKKDTENYCEMLEKLSFEVFYTRSGKNEFVIGDNPVLIFEHDNKAIYYEENDNVIIDGKIFIMPLSPQYVLVFFDKAFKKNIYDYLNNINAMQFALSSQFVYGHDGVHLEDGLRQYYEHAYDYLHRINPSYVKENRLERGAPLCIDQPDFKFEGDALNKIFEIYGYTNT